MSLTLTYENEKGKVVMGGGRNNPLQITAVEGLGLPERDYNVAVYANHNGQETLSSRANARCIMIGVEIVSNNVAAIVRETLSVFSESGMLYIKNSELDRRIYCNQIQLPDVTRVINGRIATFAVQLVCDEPFFEDLANTVTPLYRKRNMLETPFVLPCVFSEIIVGGSIEIKGNLDVEPVITIYYPKALENAESIILTNETTGKKISIEYAPISSDVVVIDVKKRKITSKTKGNLINSMTTDSFLGDFVLKKGINDISVNIGDVTTGFMIECKYNNCYNEAVIV